MKSLLTLLLTAFALNTAIAEDTASLKASLPAVQVKTLDGKSVNIQDMVVRGHITILFFWETFCGPSLKGLDNIFDNYDDWQKAYHCDLLGINQDDARNASKVKPLVNGRGWPFTFITDENKDLARALNIPNCPYLLLLDQNGKIVYRHSGFAEGFETELELQLRKLVK